MILFKRLRLLLVIGLFSHIAMANDTNEIASTGEKPNILMIVVDDLNDYQGVFGGHPQVKTPNIDRLAKSGIRFTNAQSNVPVCQPSRSSLFTGVYPHDSGDYGWTSQEKQKVLKHNKTMMELFNENGYYTLGTGKLMHKEKRSRWDNWGLPTNINYGPLYWNGKRDAALPTVPAPFSNIGGIDGSYGRLSDVGTSTRNAGKDGVTGFIHGWNRKGMRYVNENDRDLLPDEKHAQWAVKKINQLAKTDSQQPFFMGVGFVRPHTPLYAPDRFFDMYPIESLELAPWMKGDEKDSFYKDVLPEDIKGLKYYRDLVASYDGDRELALKHFLQAYLACITFMDEQLGKVIDALDANPELSKNTMVVFTADHGWQMGEKGYLFKNSPWEESARIPFIVRAVNGKGAGREVEQPVSLIDIFPTFIDYADLKGSHKKNDKAGDLGGFSLRPLIDNSGSWQGPNGALTVIGNYGNAMKVKAVAKQNYAYRTKDWRYIRYTNGQEELYNHNNDPYEWHNVAASIENRKVKAKLIAEINDIVSTLR